MEAKAFVALGTVVLTVILIAIAAAIFASRDDATVPQAQPAAAGVVRPSGAAPKVTPGNVVLLYSDERLTRALRRLAERAAGPPDPALTAAGQAVLVQRRPNQRVAVTAVTATRMLAANGPDDPALSEFVEYWLGRKS